MIAIALILALAVSGGVSVAAENAVPGDALYVVKTTVNENVRAALAVSTEAEARWQAKAAERRLEEGQELAARGELSAEAAADIGAQFDNHAEAALEGAQKLSAEGDTETSSEITAELQTMIVTYADVFARADVTGSVNARVGGSGATNINVASGDVDADGQADVTIKNTGAQTSSSANAYAEGGSRAEAKSTTKIEGSVKIDLDL